MTAHAKKQANKYKIAKKLHFLKWQNLHVTLRFQSKQISNTEMFSYEIFLYKLHILYDYYQAYMLYLLCNPFHQLPICILMMNNKYISIKISFLLKSLNQNRIQIIHILMKLLSIIFKTIQAPSSRFLFEYTFENAAYHICILKRKNKLKLPSS